MNRFRLILFGALAILMAGCSKDNPREPEMEPWVNDLSLPVPIEFGTSGITVRTKADAVVESNFSNAKLGIFALDYENEHAFDTVPQMATVEKHGVLMANNTAFCENGRIKFTTSTTNPIEQTWYYPYGSADNYSFFAYHKRGESRYIENKPGDGFYVNIDLSGENNYDVLYAWSEAATYGGLDGYNARYIRKIKAAGDVVYNANLPNLEFKHLTTAVAFRFSISDVELSRFVKVKSISVKAPSKVKLCIANRDPSKSGTLATLAHNDPAYDEADTLITLDCSGISLQAAVDESTPGVTDLGTLFLHIPNIPDEDEVLKATMVVQIPVMEAATGASNTQTATFELDLKAEGGEFRQGHVYTYTIEMAPSAQVEVKASLLDWVAGVNGDSSGKINGVVDSSGLTLE